ncbi:MAG TPA: hypothetical protein DD725_10395 [Deltaproteobacteria bacterium]|nr:hypothetical protein [Deltaproteobacteria bacterium]
MGKLIVELPDEIHGELRKKAAISHKTLKDIITGLIHQYLSASEKKAMAKSNTGLCGKWEDERAADDIIKDIKTSRRWFARQKN